MEKEENKEKEKKIKEESDKSIIGNIIMISPIPAIYKKLNKIAKDDGTDISSLVEKIVENYVSRYKKDKSKFDK